MKKLALVLMFALTGSAHAADATVEVKVKGMVCSFCAHGLDKKFKAQPAVREVKVDLETARLTLTVKPGGAIADDEIRRLVLDSGYEVDAITRPAVKPE